MTTFRMRSFGTLLLIGWFAFGLFGRAVGQTLPGSAGAPVISGSWAIGSIRTADVKPAQVKALLGPDAAEVGATVCDYAFADIAGDGFYRLLVSVDYSGRRWCNQIEVFANDVAPPQDIHAWNVEKIVDTLVKNAGHETLRVPQAITDYEGTHCIAIVPIYYSFSGSAFVTATAEHAADYQALRENLHLAAPADICSEVVADKVDRLLGDKTAGFSHAKAWMESSDPSVRRKAVRVFEDIDDSASVAALKVLSNDKDPVVSMEARAAAGQ
jgi:hypothetical protein